MSEDVCILQIDDSEHAAAERVPQDPRHDPSETAWLDVTLDGLSTDAGLSSGYGGATKKTGRAKLNAGKVRYRVQDGAEKEHPSHRGSTELGSRLGSRKQEWQGSWQVADIPMGRLADGQRRHTRATQQTGVRLEVLGGSRGLKSHQRCGAHLHSSVHAQAQSPTVMSTLGPELRL